MPEVWPKGQLQQWRDLVETARRIDDRFDWTLDPEIQTDKPLIKVAACQYCRRPLVVTTFYVDAWLKCSPCKGEGDGKREPGSVEVVQQGRTEPRLAADLSKVLINPQFAHALCPVHPDDESHVMELKTAHVSEHYGPFEYRMVNGKLTPVQTAPGETVMHQCLKCYAVVYYATTAVTQFKRVNEIREGKNANRMADSLGTRDDNLDAWKERVRADEDSVAS